MTVKLPLRIGGTGRFLPQRVVDNAELEKLCSASPGSFDRSAAGVKTRHWADSDETNSAMGAKAARDALQHAMLEAFDLDLILNASGTQEQAIPDGGPLIQKALDIGDSGIPCMSVHTTCLGFMHALDLAGCYIQAGRYGRILIVNSDIASVGLNFDEPESAMLFGDAATAILIEKAYPTRESGIELARFQTFGDGASFTEIRGGGSKHHPNDPETTPEDNLFHMDGGQIFAYATRRFLRFVKDLDEEWGEPILKSVDWIVPHQPSMKAMKVLERLGADMDKVVITLQKYGNCVSTSIPLAFYEATEDERIQEGDRVLFIGTGAGLSFGAIVLKY